MFYYLSVLYSKRLEKKCFVWKHKVHVIDPGILLWGMLASDWLAERLPIVSDGARSARGRSRRVSVFLDVGRCGRGQRSELRFYL